jgi:cytochrome c
VKKLLLSLFLVIHSIAPASGVENTASPLPGDEHFVIEDVATGFVDAMEIAVAPDGAVFVIERTGAVKRVSPESGEVATVAILDVEIRNGEFARETGLLGITLDPGFAENQWLYLFYSVKAEPVQRLARFTFAEGTLADEKVLLEFSHERDQAVCHEGGSLTFGPDGNLYLSTGDNTCPFKSSGYGPIDERKQRHFFDAQRSAANSNDLRGKILRIRPTAAGGYEIPQGNLFAVGTTNTRPEIYATGCRTPFRISVDAKTGFVYWGEVGPDAAAETERGPSGFDEINQARKPGYFGWPYFVADNKAYADFDFEKEIVGAKFDPQQPRNDSPNNTGIVELPPATLPLWHYPRASACAGPVYHRDAFPDSAANVFPEVFDGALLVYDWTSAWLRVLKLDQNGDVLWNEPWMSRHLFVHPMDMELGNNGEIWLLEYGSAWYDGKDGRLRRISYTEEPVALDLTQNDPRMDGLDREHPGAKLIASTTCLACHMTKQTSIGPTYRDVAKKYRDDPAARDSLAAKILSGGTGVWGPVPMPPHPQHNIEETQQMVDAIMGFREKGHGTAKGGE